MNGFDEAIVLTAGGHASEASAANLFVVRDGVVLTPPVYDDILEGITRKAMIELCKAEGLPVEVRSIDRSELYIADEIFLCGTGVQVSPVIEVDHRAVGSGAVGPIGRAISERYFDAVRGRLPQFKHWLTPIGAAPSDAPGSGPRRWGERRRRLAGGHDDVDRDARVGDELGRHAEDLLEQGHRRRQLVLVCRCRP